MEQIKLNAELRKDSGKGVAHKLRASGTLPAVLYGPEVDPIPIIVNNKELVTFMRKHGHENKLIDLNVSSESEDRKVIIRELQKDPVDGSFLHVDFYQVSMTKKLQMKIPIVLTGTPVGATNGGITQHIVRELEVACLPTNIPSNIEIDISEMEIGDSMHVSSIEVSDVDILTNPARTFVTVVPPTVIKKTAEEEAAELEAAELEAAEGEEGAEGAEGEAKAEDAGGEKKDK